MRSLRGSRLRSSLALTASLGLGAGGLGLSSGQDPSASSSASAVDARVVDGQLQVDAEVQTSLPVRSAADALATTSFPVATAVSVLVPEASPPGANDFACTPTAERPQPVVLVHGTFENAFSNWQRLSPQLVDDGYCVFALNYGAVEGQPVKGLDDIRVSAGQLSDFVDLVLAETGAEQVDVVGHSQGGLMPRYYLQELGGDAHVDDLVGLAPSNYGTTFAGVLSLITALPGGEQLTSVPCEACAQQEAGSQFLAELNADGDTVPGVRYTVISTELDQVVTPFTNTFLRDPGVSNTTVQDVCRVDLTDHLGISYDPIALQLVQNALDPASAVRPACVPVLPVLS